MDNSIIDRLHMARNDLLDLTAQNRLVNTPRTSSRSSRLEIVDEMSDEVFRHHVVEKKAMRFAARQESEGGQSEYEEPGTILLGQPEEEIDDNGVAARHRDDRLQTALTSESLQRKLLKFYYDARTYEEEQGVNILYLALGFLKWYEADASDRERYAPLILLPVELDRKSASSRFKLSCTEDDLSTNLSLQEKLLLEFGVRLPELPLTDDLSPSEYFADVRTAIAKQPRWEVLENDIVLWFFSFAKFLMYRDLAAENWPAERTIETHPLIASILDSGFQRDPPICDEEENIDGILEPLEMIHVMDADSSQSIAIEEVKQGRNLVIQGPPGTGKSQTISNLIATAVKQGKKVLFVAEKMAALEVVKRRLDGIGLGDMCLELHSHKANKRAVLERLSHALNLSRPKVKDIEKQASELKAYRDKLNRHAELLHSYLEPAKITPYQIVGELVRLRAAGVEPPSFRLTSPLTWTAIDFREKGNVLSDLSLHLRQIGDPSCHPWRGVRLEAVLPQDVDRISQRVSAVLERCERLSATTEKLANLLQVDSPQTPSDVATVARFAQRLLAAPQMDRSAIADEVWDTSRDDISTLIEEGKMLRACREKLADVVSDVAWTTDVDATRRHVAAYGRSWFRFFNGNYRDAQATLRGILTVDPPKRLNERIEILDRLIRGQRSHHCVEHEPRMREIGRRAFGTFWRGSQSDWTALELIAIWEAESREAQIPADFRGKLTSLTDIRHAAPLVEQIRRDLKPLLTELQHLLELLDFDIARGFKIGDLRLLPLTVLRERLEAWRSDVESLTKWIAYFVRWRKLESEGMGDLSEQLDRGLIASQEALDRFQMAYYEELMREVFRRHPELAEFNGMSHDQVLARFKDLDRQ